MPRPQGDHPLPPQVLKFLDPPLILLFDIQLICFMVKLSFCMCYYACWGKHFRAGITILMIASSLSIVHVPVVLLVLVHRYLFHTWATFTNKTRYLTRDHTPLAGLYFYNSLFTLKFLI